MKYRNSQLQINKKKSIEWLKGTASEGKLPKGSKITREQLAELENNITGKIVFPWSPGYNTDKEEFNNVYPATPLIIVYVANFEDVRLSLDLARETSIEFVVRSGGHSLAGFSACDGLIIDMSQMHAVYVDTKNQLATVEAGCTFEKLFPILEFYGLHVPGGGCPTVAVAGYMMGGGYGLTSRAFGMNCDRVVAVTLMLADGKIVVADKSQNADLFWAIRGGTGGNFGVLLNITYELVPLGNIFGKKINFVIDTDPAQAATAIHTIQQNFLSPGVYPNLGIETVLCTDDDGLKKVMFCSTWIGDEADYDKALAPVLSLPGAQVAVQKSGKYSVVNAAVLDGTPNLPEGIMAYSRSAYIGKMLSQDDWYNILKFYLTCPNKYTMVDMECYGGKINEIQAGENAFIHRDVTMDFFCDAFFNTETNDQKKNEIWLEEFFEFMKQYGNGHSYQNYPNRLQTDFRQAYWGSFYPQLVSVKNKYDPTNFFKYQQSIGGADENKADSAATAKATPIIYEKY